MPRKKGKGKSKSSNSSSAAPKQKAEATGGNTVKQNEAISVSTINGESFPSQVILHGDLISEDRHEDTRELNPISCSSDFSPVLQDSKLYLDSSGDEWTVVGKQHNKHKTKKKSVQESYLESNGDEWAVVGKQHNKHKDKQTYESLRSKSEPIVQVPETSNHKSSLSSTFCSPVNTSLNVSNIATQSSQLSPVTSGINSTTEQMSLLSIHFDESFQKTGITVAKRPGFGTKGRPIELVANYFLLKLGGNDIYHYDVDIAVPSSRKKEAKSLMSHSRNIKEDKEKGISHVEIQQKRNVGKQRCREIINKLICNDAFKKYKPAYDGQRNLYTASKLPITGKQTFNVELVENQQKKTFLVTIQPVEKNGVGNVISLAPLREVYAGRSREIPQDAIMAFDTILCHRDPPFHQVSVGRSFFFFSEFRKNPLDGHTEIWTGYNQSVHLTQKGPAVVVNLAARAFHTAGFVIDYACDVLGFDITERPLRPEHIRILTEALSKIRVEVTHLPYPRKYTVQSVTEKSAEDLRLEFNGIIVSVAEYFTRRYEGLKFPDLPCLNMKSSGKSTFMPMEVCVILPGQLQLGKLDKTQASEMIRQTAVPPSERFGMINKHAQVITKVSGAYMDQFGLHMEPQFMNVTGRVLDPPKLAYRDQVHSVEPDAKGTWKMDGRHFYQSAGGSIKWIILSFAKDITVKHLSGLSSKLVESSQKAGLCLKSPIDMKVLDSQVPVFNALNDAKKLGVNFALVVLSRSDKKHTYDEVKYIADKRLGLITQCMDEKVVQECYGPSGHAQITNNLCLKLNSKLGGINHVFSKKPTILMEQIIIMGADAAHSPKGSRCPSIAAVVGCLDDVLSKYAVTCRIQENPDKTKMPQEIIFEMKSMANEMFNSYRRKNSGQPKRIVFFRDGVSEGQFQTILGTELGLIQQACQEVFLAVLPVTFIVVQKRHQTRIRPRDPKDGVGRMGNVPTGTTVDTTITHPVYYDFYICSHEGIQGTSKPTRYVVMHDDSKFDPDEVQKLCYHLCHVYARCNRSISIPPPVMYAHLAAARAKKYVDLHLSRSNGKMSEGNSLPQEVTDAVNNIGSIESSMFFV